MSSRIQRLEETTRLIDTATSTSYKTIAKPLSLDDVLLKMQFVQPQNSASLWGRVTKHLPGGNWKYLAEEGKNCLLNEDYDAAISLFLKSNTEDKNVRFLLAVSYEKAKKYIHAYKQLQLLMQQNLSSEILFQTKKLISTTFNELKITLWTCDELKELSKIMDLVSLFKSAALNGEPISQCNWAICHENGIGVKKDESEAFKWYKQSALQGNTHAQWNTGFCYEKGIGVAKDEFEGFKWYYESALQGNADAQCSAGFCCENGIGVAKDEFEGVKWYQKSALQGNCDSQLNLGFCYEKGIGVAKDESEGFKWYQKAALQGSADAQFNLGFCYDNGVGVSQDKIKAVEWYQKAAKQKNVSAQNNLGLCYDNGEGVKQDKRKAVELYREAANQGDVDAQSNLRICLAEIIPKKPENSVLDKKAP